jgi:hypothetical protein
MSTIKHSCIRTIRGWLGYIQRIPLFNEQSFASQSSYNPFAWIFFYKTNDLKLTNIILMHVNFPLYNEFIIMSSYSLLEDAVKMWFDQNKTIKRPTLWYLVMK